MAYKITQHRRGTYEEWNSLNIVPYEGELIIVEFDDNIRKCKFGDGITAFSDLPYATDWLVEELGDQIDDLKSYADDTIDSVTADIYHKIEDLIASYSDGISEVKSTVNKQIAELSSDVDNIAKDLLKVDNTVKALVAPAVGELDTKYSNELSQIVKQHEADKNVIYQTIDNKVSEVSALVNSEISKNNIKTEEALAGTKSELITDYTNKIADVSTDIQNLSKATANTLSLQEESIKSVRDNIITLTSDIDSRVSSSIATYENTTNNSLAEITEAINKINVAIEQIKQRKSEGAEPQVSFATSNLSDEKYIAEMLEDLKYKVIALEAGASVTTSDIKNLSFEVSRLASSFASLSDQHRISVNNISATIDALESRVSAADTDIHSLISSQNTYINEELAKLSAADTLLYQVIYRIQDTLTKKIETADAAVREELNSDVARINKSVADLKLRLDNQITQAQANLAEGLAGAKAELSKKIDSLEKLHDTKFEAVESTLTTLGNTITTGQSTLTNSVEALHTDVINNSTRITNNSIAIGQLSTNLDNKVAVINTGLETVNSKIDTQITNLESKLQTKIDTTDKTLQSQANSIVSVQDKLDDLLEDLDNRIADKILEDKSDVNSSIIELREAIKQIKLALDTRGESSVDIVTLASSVSRLSKEIDDLAADDVILYQIIYRIRDELLTSINSKYAESESLVAEKISSINKALSDTQSNINKNVEDLSIALNDRINTVDKEAVSRADKLERIIFSKTGENFEAISTLTSTVTDNKTKIDAEIKALTDEISTNKSNIAINKAAINQANNTFNNTTKVINTDIDLLSNRLDAQEKRISGILALEDGSTTGDAELVDIRTGYNGEVHASAGDAVRAIGTNLVKLENSLEQYIGTQAIDGLYYDVEGEVEPGQTYMLYLKSGDTIIPDSGVQIISGAGGGSGSGSSASSLKLGYITTSPVIVTPTDKAMIYFTFSGTDSSGDIILQASATWKANGVTIANGVVKDGENEFDVTKYIKTGTTKILLTVIDDNGSIVTKSWNVQKIELTLDSKFNDKRKYTANESIVFDYIPSGAIEKTAVFILDGQEIGRALLGKEVSGTTVSYELPPKAHGSYLLDVYLEAEIKGDTVPHIQKDILWYDPAGTAPIIGTSVQSLTVKQYSTTNITYTVYDPAHENPTVTITVDDVESAPIVVTPNKDYGNTPTAVYSYVAATSGNHQIKITCGSTKKVINVFTEDLGISIAPVTTGLAFDFNPAGRSNAEIIDGEVIINNNVKLIASDNFDWINGGYIPNDPDGPCFCIKAGSTATIDYELFANEAKVSGKEFKLIFKTKNISNPDTIFLSCLDNTTDKDHIGIAMGANNAHIYGKNGNLELAYSEEDVIEFEFNISKDTEAVPMVMGYEDGVPSRPMVYDSTYSFKQNTPKTITIGSDDCDIYIYRFKVYNTSLSNSDILKNFIADARTADEMVTRYNRNQIYDENQKLTAEVLAEKCPWLRVYKISAPHFTNSKSDKVSGTTIQQIHCGGDPVLDNWVAYNSQHSGQGTSSNNYGAAGRNLDFIMNGDDSYFELGDGTITNEISLSRTSVPVAYLNAKVNIASSNNLTNAILANRFNQFNPYKRPFVRDEGYDISNIKDTMEFYNCVIFIQETDPDMSTHREFADTDWHFYAIGNIGDSKKTDKTRLTDQKDPYECCVEIMDVGLPLSAFPRDTMMNAMDYAVDEKTNERVYTWAKDDNLGILYEKQADGSYELTSDTTIDYDKTYYVDILLHDDFSEDFTYGWRYLSNKKDSNIVNTCKQAWIDFYRFVTTSSDEEFKANLKNYFIVDSALYYYLFTTRYCMVDNRAKNTFWHYGKAADGTRKWDLCWDYDNDTACGLNNFGKQLYRYGLEDIDVDAAGKEVFRQSNSLFFCRIRDLFASELKQMYQALESKDAWNASAFINICDAWQDQFPEELWRIDIERKYIRTYNKSFINGAGDSQFLVNMSNGKMKYHRRQWERGQEQYMASKYQTPTALGDKYHANFRVNQFSEGETDDFVIPTNYQFTLTPFSYIYLNVYYNSGSPISVRVTDDNINTPIVVPYLRDKADIINVGSASAIRDFGDLAPLYADTISVANATRIKRLKIGDSTPGYRNAGFSSLTTGSNGLLEELDITNITSFNKTLDLKELINLKKLYAFGTSIPGVIFAEGSKIEEVKLPALNSLLLKNLKYLATAKLQLDSYANVVDLTIEGCPLINQLSLLEACTNVTKTKLDNINFGTKTYEYFVNNIFKLKGVDESAANAQLTGSVHFESLDGAQFNELKARYPHLVVTYDLLTSTITFKNTDLESTIYSENIINAADCADPSTLEGWAAPAREATAEFTYEWFGWSESPNTMVNYEHLGEDEAAEAEQSDYNKYRINSIKHVEGDRMLYPVFKAIRNSYEVQFINPTNNNEVLYSVMVPYGQDAVYVGATPTKLDTATPSLYYFLGWSPSPSAITGATVCYAQFTILDSTWYTINLLDITDCEDYSGNVANGYQLNTANKTMAITSCKNKLNKAVKVPAKLNVNGVDYAVVAVGGFRDHDNIELLSLPDSLLEISSHGFYSCNYLTELQIPESVTSIGTSAFQGCTSIDEISIPRKVSRIGEAAFADCSNLIKIIVDANNKQFSTLQDGLILLENATGKLLQGLSGCALTSDMGNKILSLGTYCFSNTKIASAGIPEGITTISANAFSHCDELVDLTLPSTLTKLDATCFAWCSKLANVELPNSLIDISTYVFNSCAIENIEIPSSVNYVRAQSFGNMPTLKTVTFKKRLNIDNSVFVPDISSTAFAGAGSETNPVVFNIPWTEQQHNNYFTGSDSEGNAKDPGFGAKYYRLNFINQEAI